jgi:ElaA protein
MTITWQLKSFEQLTNNELYDILALRASVFVVEQNCAFLDTDGAKDLESLHLFAQNQLKQVIAYCRLLPAGLAYPECSIGRVVTDSKYRNTGLGRTLMQKAIQAIEQKFGTISIRIGAQLYLKSFYESFGFKIASNTYLEDGIAHIEMLMP